MSSGSKVKFGVLGLSQVALKVGRAYAVPKGKETKIFLDVNDKVQEILVKPADHFKLMFDDFCREILKGDESTKDYEGDLMAQARVLHAARKSDKENRIVNINEL